MLRHQKRKRRKKSGSKVEPASYINLAAAILQLVTAISLMRQATTGRGGEILPCPKRAYHRNNAMSTSWKVSLSHCS